MKKLILILGLLLIFQPLYAGAPSRTKTYTTGTVISPSDVTENEDNIFRYLQSGVDTIKDASIVNADLGSNAVTTDKISDGTIVNADISGTAAITYSRLSLTNSLLNADIAATAAITYSKLSLGSSILSTDIKDGEIVNADINASAAIVDTKLATISTAGKVLGASLNTLSGIPSGAGQIPVANLGTGTGSASNYLRGDGAWTTMSSPTQVTTGDTTTAFSTETTVLSVAKTITSGHTVLLIAGGSVGGTGAADVTMVLKQGSTTVQTCDVTIPNSGTKKAGWSLCGTVTGLSGSITFSVTAAQASSSNNCYGNLVVLEF